MAEEEEDLNKEYDRHHHHHHHRRRRRHHHHNNHHHHHHHHQKQQQATMVMVVATASQPLSSTPRVHSGLAAEVRRVGPGVVRPAAGGESARVRRSCSKTSLNRRLAGRGDRDNPHPQQNQLLRYQLLRRRRHHHP
jgi:hypothetical protein